MTIESMAESFRLMHTGEGWQVEWERDAMEQGCAIGFRHKATASLFNLILHDDGEVSIPEMCLHWVSEQDGGIRLRGIEEEMNEQG